MPEILSSAERKQLRGRAHRLRPVVQIGTGGLSAPVLRSIDQALSSHELIKIRFLERRDEKRELVAEISRQLSCQLVGMIGHVAILFRRREGTGTDDMPTRA